MTNILLSQRLIVTERLKCLVRLTDVATSTVKKKMLPMILFYMTLKDNNTRSSL